MTVKTFDPTNQLPVKFTAAAIKHLTKQVSQKSARGVEFNVKESGCSGFKYLLELAFEIGDDSNTYHLSEDLKLFISRKIIPLVNGTEVDYLQEGVNFKLDFKNPNATASCGCGESFSVEPQ